MNTPMSILLCVSFTNAAIYRLYADVSPKLLMQTDLRVGKEIDGVGSSNDDSTVVSRKRRSIFTDIAERLAEVVSKFSAFQEPRAVGINSHAFDTNSLKRGNPLDEKIRKESNIVYKKVTDGENGKDSKERANSGKQEISDNDYEKPPDLSAEVYEGEGIIENPVKLPIDGIIEPVHEKIRKESNIVYKKVTDGENGKDSKERANSGKQEISDNDYEKPPDLSAEVFEGEGIIENPVKLPIDGIIEPVHEEVDSYIENHVTPFAGFDDSGVMPLPKKTLDCLAEQGLPRPTYRDFNEMEHDLDTLTSGEVKKKYKLVTDRNIKSFEMLVRREPRRPEEYSVKYSKPISTTKKMLETRVTPVPGFNDDIPMLLPKEDLKARAAKGLPPWTYRDVNEMHAKGWDGSPRTKYIAVTDPRIHESMEFLVPDGIEEITKKLEDKPLPPEMKSFLDEKLKKLTSIKSDLDVRRETLLDKYWHDVKFKKRYTKLINLIFAPPFGDASRNHLENLVHTMAFPTKYNVIKEILEIQKNYNDLYKRGHRLLRKVQPELLQKQVLDLEEKLFKIYDHTPRPFPDPILHDIQMKEFKDQEAAETRTEPQVTRGEDDIQF